MTQSPSTGRWLVCSICCEFVEFFFEFRLITFRPRDDHQRRVAYLRRNESHANATSNRSLSVRKQIDFIEVEADTHSGSQCVLIAIQGLELSMHAQTQLINWPIISGFSSFKIDFRVARSVTTIVTTSWVSEALKWEAPHVSQLDFACEPVAHPALPDWMDLRWPFSRRKKLNLLYQSTRFDSVFSLAHSNAVVQKFSRLFQGKGIDHFA